MFTFNHGSYLLHPCAADDLHCPFDLALQNLEFREETYKDRRNLTFLNADLMPRKQQRDCQSDSGSNPDSDSDLEAGRRLPPGLGRGKRWVLRIVRAPGPAPDPRVICPGCRAIFASLNNLKLHRNSSRLANAACRAAASANKRPGGGAASVRDQIDRMMGYGNQGIASIDAPDSSRFPRHVDG